MGGRIIALVVTLVVGGASEAVAEAVTVPLLLVEPPADFDPVRFGTALETYVPNARIATRAQAAATPAALCAEAQAAARTVGSPVALWARWTGGTMVIERVGEAGCGAIESSVVDVVADRAFVYRVAALKVASLVRDVPARVVPDPSGASAPPNDSVGLPNDRSDEPNDRSDEPSDRSDEPNDRSGEPNDRSAVRAVELGVSGIASTEAADRVALACVGGWFGRGWIVGGTVMVGGAEGEAGPGGSGSARVLGGFVGGRRTLVRAPRWQLEVTAEVGVLTVGAVATRTGADVDMSSRVWTPAAALAPRVRLPVAGPLAVALGPTLEASSRAVRLSLGDTPLYNASRLRLRWDVRAEVRF